MFNPWERVLKRWIQKASHCNKRISRLPPLLGRVTFSTPINLNTALGCLFSRKWVSRGEFLLPHRIVLRCSETRVFNSLFVFPTWALPQGQVIRYVTALVWQMIIDYTLNSNRFPCMWMSGRGAAIGVVTLVTVTTGLIATRNGGQCRLC